MEYQDYLKEKIMESRHAFIYGAKEDRTVYLQNLAKEYSFNSLIKSPVGIYIKDNGLPTCQNENCDRYIIDYFNSRYFEMLVSYEIIDKLLKEGANLEETESNILKFFNKFIKNEKIKSLIELREELLNAKNIFNYEYEKYINTGELSGFQSKLRINMILLLDFLCIKLKKSLPNLERINLLIDKDSDYSTIYTQLINFYLGARCNADLSIKVGCENLNDWKTIYDLNGNIINSIHDYDTITMDEWALIRKKDEVLCSKR